METAPRPREIAQRTFFSWLSLGSRAVGGLCRPGSQQDKSTMHIACCNKTCVGRACLSLQLQHPWSPVRGFRSSKGVVYDWSRDRGSRRAGLLASTRDSPVGWGWFDELPGFWSSSWISNYDYEFPDGVSTRGVGMSLDSGLPVITRPLRLRMMRLNPL